LRDDINKKLAANGYDQKLKSIKIRKYEESTLSGMRSTEISHEFEKGSFIEREILQANLFVSRLLREFLESNIS